MHHRSVLLPMKPTSTSDFLPGFRRHGGSPSSRAVRLPPQGVGVESELRAILSVEQHEVVFAVGPHGDALFDPGMLGSPRRLQTGVYPYGECQHENNNAAHDSARWPKAAYRSGHGA